MNSALDLYFIPSSHGHMKKIKMKFTPDTIIGNRLLYFCIDEPTKDKALKHKKDLIKRLKVFDPDGKIDPYRKPPEEPDIMIETMTT